MKKGLAAIVFLSASFTLTGCQLLKALVTGLARASSTTATSSSSIPGLSNTSSTQGLSGLLGQLGSTIQQASASENVPTLTGADTLGASQQTGVLPNSAQIQAVGQRLDAYLTQYPGSRLQGYGTFIAACSAKYGVPVDLAMAMFGVEATFCSKGVAPKCNNPGNIKDTKGKYGTITGTYNGHAVYDSMETGIEAYFRLLSNPEMPYWGYIQSGDIDSLIATYAPSSDGNDVNGYRAQVDVFRREIQQTMMA